MRAAWLSRPFRIVILAALLGFPSPPVEAQLPPGQAAARAQAARQILLEHKAAQLQALPEAARGKVAAPLAALYQRFTSGSGSKAERLTQAIDPENPFLRFDETDRVEVYIHLREGQEPETFAALAGTSFDLERHDRELGIAKAWLAVEDLASVAALEGVTRLTAPRYAMRRIGSVTSEGDAIIGAPALRAAGLSGAGVKVGVLSDGVDGLASAQASGDLPNNVAQFGFCSFLPCNEGTALLEIVHDIAPGASLGFCAGADDVLDFRACIDSLADDFQADVIVDDLAIFSEPYFEDGPVALKVQEAAKSALFVSAAGNDALVHYEADYRNQFGFHDFGLAAGGVSDTELNIDVPAGGLLVVFFQWADPFGQSGNDYDLLLFDQAFNLIASSLGPQDGDDDPLEFLAVINTAGFTQTALLQIQKFSGSDRRLKLFLIGSSLLEYSQSAGSVFGHPAVPEVLAVGAIDAGDPGNNTIEPYSSRGPAHILFPAEEIRPKPDIAGIDGVSVTGAAGFPTTFFGTSAAAPHLAGLAALLLEDRPQASPHELAQAIRDGAVDLGPAGFDNSFGAGRAEASGARTALQAAVSAGPIFASVLPISRSVQIGDTATAFATIINAGPTAAQDCGITLLDNLPTDFFFQTTDPTTNALVGSPDLPVDIPAGGLQTYVFGLTPSGPIGPQELRLRFDCANTPVAPDIPGVTTLLHSAEAGPVVDIIALSLPPTHDGILALPPTAPRSNAFAVATTNLGIASNAITVQADTGDVVLPLAMSVCRTDPTGTSCIEGPVDAASGLVTAFAENGTPTFAIFATATGDISFNPAENRIFVRFKTPDGKSRGATSVAVRAD